MKKKRGFNNFNNNNGCSEKPTDHRSTKRKTITYQPEKIIHTYGAELCSQSVTVQPTMSVHNSITAVESILMYRFRNKSLLQEALTHSSCTDGLSYQRLEFLGDSVISLAISKFFFLEYPDVDAGLLTRLRAANVSNEKLARVAVKHGLNQYIRHNKATVLNEKVSEFLTEVEEEDMVVYGGQMKAPKVLADIVESVAAAVYVDCEFNLRETWNIFRHLLEPLVTLDVILAEPQPITALYEACQKDGKQVDIQYTSRGDRTVASVYVDGKFIASCSSETKENAKLHAAETALLKITNSSCGDTDPQIAGACHDATEIEGAKQKLHELCSKKRWQKPTYKLEQELGPSHDRRYIASVEVELAEVTLFAKGNERSKVKDAENSAASMMFSDLLKSGYA